MRLKGILNDNSLEKFKDNLRNNLEDLYEEMLNYVCFYL